MLFLDPFRANQLRLCTATRQIELRMTLSTSGMFPTIYWGRLQAMGRGFQGSRPMTAPSTAASSSETKSVPLIQFPFMSRLQGLWLFGRQQLEPSRGPLDTKRMQTQRVKSRKRLTCQTNAVLASICPLFWTAHSDSACLADFSPRFESISANCRGEGSKDGTTGFLKPNSLYTPATAGVSDWPSAEILTTVGSASWVALPKTVAHGKKSATSTSKIMNKSATT